MIAALVAFRMGRPAPPIAVVFVPITVVGSIAATDAATDATAAPATAATAEASVEAVGPVHTVLVRAFGCAASGVGHHL